MNVLQKTIEVQESFVGVVGETVPKAPKDVEEVFDEPIIWCNELWRIIDGITNLHGSSVSLTLILFLAFYRVNVMSIIYAGLVGLSFIVSPSHTYLFKTNDEDQERIVLRNRRHKQLMWTMLVVWQIVIIIVEYSALLFVDPAALKVSYSFFCSSKGKTQFSPIPQFSSISDYEMCQDQWIRFLDLGDYTFTSLFFDFICLFVTLIAKFALDKPLKDMNLAESPVEGDSDDFTQVGKIKTQTDSIRFLFYTQFYFVVLFYMLIMVSTFN